MSSHDQLRRRTQMAQRRMLLIVLLVITAAGGVWLYLHKVQSREPAEPWSMRVEAALEQDNIEEARNILLAEFRNTPEDVELIQMLGEVEFAATDYHKAEEYFQRALKLAPQNAAYLKMRLAHCAMSLYEIDPTLELLNESLRLSPGQDDVRRTLVNLYESLLLVQPMREQIVQLDLRGEATALDVAMYCAGDRLRYDVDENIDFLHKFLKNDPGHSILATALAYNLMRATRREEALQILKTARAKCQRDDRWRIDLALIEEKIHRRDYRSAAEELAELPADADSQSRTWIARGRVWRELNELEKALPAFENASLLDPFDAEPHYARSQILLAEGRKDQAEAEADLSQKLHQLTTYIEDALVVVESEVPDRVFRIAGQLADLNYPRHAEVCLKWLISQKWKPAEARLRLDKLRARFPVIPPTLRFEQKPLLPIGSVSRATDAAKESRRTANGAAGRIVLSDVASEVGLDFRYFHHDRGRRLFLTPLGAGAAAFDYDGDGWTDLYFPQGSGRALGERELQPESDALYRNLQGRGFARVDLAGAEFSGAYGHGAAGGDWDEDGFTDLIVCHYGRNSLYRNNGDGTFSRIPGEDCRFGNAWSTSAAFCDFDFDGDLDFYVVNYVVAPLEGLEPTQIDEDYSTLRPTLYEAEQDRLYENLGNGQFADITAECGIQAREGKGLGLLISDFDVDGRPDVFVGNDTTANFLFRNTSAQRARISFENVSLTSGTALNREGRAESCMGIACADVDRNGFPDLFVTNFEKETNTFYHNAGGLLFEDETERYGLADPSFRMLGWGAQFVDLDFDGWDDLLIANGHLHDRPMTLQLFKNDSGERFVPVSGGLDFLQSPRMGRAVALLDWNRDLRNDAVVTDWEQPVSLLENRFDGASRAIAVRLIGTSSVRDGLGATIDVEFGGGRVSAAAYPGGGYMAQNENLIWVSTGGADTIERLTVRWPDGGSQTFESLPTGRFYHIVQGGRLIETAPTLLR